MDLVGYLETLPKAAVSSLYTSPWTCQAVLRGLPPLAKLYALRMVFLEVRLWHFRAPALYKHDYTAHAPLHEFCTPMSSAFDESERLETGRPDLNS